MRNKEILKNYLYWFIAFIGCMLIGILKTYAITFTDFTDVHTKTQVLVEYGTGSSPVNWPFNNSSLYQNDVRKVNFIIDNYTFQANTHYEFESHMLGKFFKGQPIYTITPNNSSATCITDSYYLNFINGEYPRWDFQCNQNVSSITITIFNSNNSVIMDSGYFGWGSAIISKTSTPISSTNNDTDIIINNNNYNTNQIIESQNNLFLSQCPNLLNMSNIVSGSGINTNNGAFYNNSVWSRSNFIKVNPNTTYQYYSKGRFQLHLAQYSSNSNSSFITITNSDIGNISITTNSNTQYIVVAFRNDKGNSNYMLEENTSKTSYCEFGTTTNKLDETNNSINNLNDTINNDDVDNDSISSAFEDFNDYLDDNSTITRLLTLPITLFTAILNNVNGTCQPFNLGALYGENLILPCIDVSQYLGNTLWTMIDVIISGFAIYAISKKMIKIFNNFSSLKEGDVIDD